MKQLAIIGLVFSSLLLTTATAQAKPTGMTKAEMNALMARSDGLNQKYGLGQYSVRQKLEEIGAWAVPSSPQGTGTPPVQVTPTSMTQAELSALMARSDGLNQEYGLGRYSGPALVSEKLAGLGTSEPTTSLASSGQGFDWNDAGIGAAFVFGAVFLAAGSVVAVRRHGHTPVAH
ncbi:MAG TPA: hypothetical protein VLB79_06370 [Solirubrobacterales bacterium]|nr:hypothetical protein [Solirubrobacterales bacterium]